MDKQRFLMKYKQTSINEKLLSKNLPDVETLNFETLKQQKADYLRKMLL